jgi:hypothetical protein
MPSNMTAYQAPAIPGFEFTYLPGVGWAYSTPCEIPAGLRVLDLARYSTVVPEPTQYSIQVGASTHVDGPGTRYLNHSCDPNVFVDAQSLSVVTLRPVPADTPLCFFYPANEWRMAASFQCNCGTPQCIGTVAGAAGTRQEVLSGYRLNRHIHDLLGVPADGK